jgi:hypothetical protein
VQFPAGENEIDWQLPYDSFDTHYQFTVLPYTETPDRYEPNNTEAEAAKLGSNVLVEGLDLMTGDVDWFEFALETPSLVTFSFPNIDLPTHDIMLSLKSSQGSDPIETCFPQDDSGTCMSVSLNPGTYRYAIDYHTFEAGNGFYSLQVKTSASLVVPTRN